MKLPTLRDYFGRFAKRILVKNLTKDLDRPAGSNVAETYVVMQSDQQQNGDLGPRIRSNVAQTNLDSGVYHRLKMPQSSAARAKFSSTSSGQYASY